MLRVLCRLPTLRGRALGRPDPLGYRARESDIATRYAPVEGSTSLRRRASTLDVPDSARFEWAPTPLLGLAGTWMPRPLLRARLGHHRTSDRVDRVHRRAGASRGRARRHTCPMGWLLDNVGAAIVALIVGGVATSTAWIIRRRAERQRSREMQRDAGSNHARLSRFLQSVRSEDVCYVPAHLHGSPRLPVLTEPAMLMDTDVEVAQSSWSLVSTAIDNLPVDSRVIRRRQKSGMELWNGDLIYVGEVDLAQTPPSLVLRRSFYFAYVTAVDRVVKALWSRRPDRRPALTDYQSLAAAVTAAEPRLWVSGAVVTVLESEVVPPEVIIHRRSASVVNAAGIRTVAPVFGFDAAMVGNNRSALGLVLYNLVREYAEELFDKEALVQANRGKWYHPDQIIDAVPEIGVLLDDLASGVARARVTGMCVNPKDCDLSIALLLQVGPSARSAELLRRHMRAGWEAASGDLGEPAAELVGLGDPRLDEWAATGELYPTSAFALDRARAVMESSARTPNP